MLISKHAYAPIALFDSGAGGISVLQEVQKLLPREQLLYFGDNKNAPYGERSDADVLQLTQTAAKRLIPQSKALVLACNTATAVAADILRRSYPDFPIIGMEPALLPALRTTERPTIAVLATAATLRSKRFEILCEKYAKNATVWRISAPEMVRMVEVGLADSAQMEQYLHTVFSALPTRPDAVVLGCTHFPFAAAAIGRVLPSVPLFDGAAGTARELARRLQAEVLLSPAPKGGISLQTSAPAALPLLTRLLQYRYPNGKREEEPYAP